MSDTLPTNQTNPFHVFISHKVNGHGRAAERIKDQLENYAKGTLKIFVSPALGPGVRWRQEVLQEIENADLFILLYLVEGMDMDWCLYEAGYFEREARQSGKQLVCMVNQGRDLPGPLEERQRLEADREGVEKLLRTIYDNKQQPVRPDLFDNRHSETLKGLIAFVLNALQPVTREPLCSRVWIKLTGQEALAQLHAGRLPGEARLSGEAEAFRQLGLREGEEMTLADFQERSEFKDALQCYVPQVANCLRRIIQRYPDLWVIPPVSLATGVRPKVLVPAYVERRGNDSYTFEFLIYQPEPDFKPACTSPFDVLCNLFFLASTFRNRIIVDWLEKFRNLQSRGANASQEEICQTVRKFKLVLGMIVLDALNRNVNAPRIIYNCFQAQDQRDALEGILDPDSGSYSTCKQQLHAALEKKSLDDMVKYLDQLQNINKTILVICTTRLQELATAMRCD